MTIYARHIPINEGDFIPIACEYINQGLLEDGLRPIETCLRGRHGLLQRLTDTPGSSVFAGFSALPLTIGASASTGLLNEIIRRIGQIRSRNQVARLLFFAPRFDNSALIRLENIRLPIECYTFEQLISDSGISLFTCFRKRSSPAPAYYPRTRIADDFRLAGGLGGQLSDLLGRLLPYCHPKMQNGALRFMTAGGVNVVKLLGLSGNRFRAVIGPTTPSGQTTFHEILSEEDLLEIVPLIQRRFLILLNLRSPETKLAALLHFDSLKAISAAAGLNLDLIESPPRADRGPIDIAAIDRSSNKMIIIELKSCSDSGAVWQLVDYRCSIEALYGPDRLGPAILVTPEISDLMKQQAKLAPFPIIFLRYDRQLLEQIKFGPIPDHFFKPPRRSRPKGMSEAERAMIIRAEGDGFVRSALDRLGQKAIDIGLVRFVPSQKIIAFRIHGNHPPVPVIHFDVFSSSLNFILRLDRIETLSLDRQKVAAIFEGALPQYRATRCFRKAAINTPQDIERAANFIDQLAIEIKQAAGGAGTAVALHSNAGTPDIQLTNK